jgi:H+-transporting ATPase
MNQLVTDTESRAAPHRSTAPTEGLTSTEANERLRVFGPNEVAERREPTWRRLSRRFWGPLPWMLEGTIVLTLLLGKGLEAVIIATLLVVNSLIGLVQQGRADDALAMLRRRLAVHARVRRDGAWTRLLARELVPGDVVRIRVGDVVAADVEVLDGHVSLDQSSLTGESVPVDVGPGDSAFGAAVVTRGEATGLVVATGSASFFGRTSMLVQTAKPATHLEQVIFRIVRYLVVIDVALVAAMLAYAAVVGISLTETAPFALIILIASVPVALPTTFTVAHALGALELSRGADDRHPGRGVLVTRLSAVQDAASMDVLCTDKTGTLTLNELSVEAIRAYPPVTDAELLELAALASDAAGQDPIDLALLRAVEPTRAATRGSRLEFVPFDPATKRTEAVVERAGQRVRLVKGMPPVVAALCPQPPAPWAADLDHLAETGARVLAVAAGPDGGDLALVGLVALADRPRPDSGQLVRELGDLGIEVKMITGDTPATARSIAAQVGIPPMVCTGADVRDQPDLATRCSVFAGVLPEDKYLIVRSLQDAGRIVGMTGDGVNDAPALKQAEVGIAVDSAVDVAKVAASMVLTDPGLVDTVAAVGVSRRIYQRMMTWTLNKLIKTAQVALFLTLAFIVTGSFVTTPLLIVLLLLANDFVTMSLAVDHARPGPRPARWQVRPLVAAAVALATVVLVESFLDLWVAHGVLHLGAHQTQTLIFLMLVFSGQATVYVVRERGRFWSSRPAGVLLAATIFDVVAVSTLAMRGIFMTSLGLPSIALVLVIAGAFMFVMDPIKIRVLHRFRLV